MRTSCKKPAIGFRIRLIFAFVLATLIAPCAHAQQTGSFTEHARWKARITEIKVSPRSPPALPMLKFTPEETWVDGQGPVQYARIRWEILGKYKSVSINGRELKPKADGTFDINFGFTNNEKALKIAVQNAMGKIYVGSFKIISIDELNKGKLSRFRFNFGAGVTSIVYTQTNIASFNETALTVKGGASFRLVPDKWDLSITSFYNAAVLGTNSGTNLSIQYLGINSRIGYHLLDAPSSFRIVMNAGLYFNTSFSAGNSIGFSNMYGPQLYPEFSYIFNNGHALLAYGKYSPTLLQGTVDFSNNREIAGGIHYIYPIFRGKFRNSIGIDISSLTLTTGTDSASTTTYSLSTGISF